YDFNNEGRDAKYSVQYKDGGRSAQATEYYRVNPHRLQLGNVGLEIQLDDGSLATLEDIKGIDQTLDLWSGLINSKFEVAVQTVEVKSCAWKLSDKVAVVVYLPLSASGQLNGLVKFPYPSVQF